jgi:hypothetical protein
MASLALGILSSQLAQHTARLQDAANENAALDLVIPAYDADLKAIQSAFNSGTSPDECVQALTLVDQNIYAYLQKQVGKPGTAWSGVAGNCAGVGRSAACDKSCTAGCCVYYNDLDPGIKCCIAAIQGGGGTATIPKVYPPSNKAYGDFSRPLYTLTFTKPKGISVATQALGVSGVNVEVAPPAQTAALSSSLLSSLTSNQVVAIIGVLGGLLLIITTLFGANALRVNK